MLTTSSTTAFAETRNKDSTDYRYNIVWRTVFGQAVLGNGLPMIQAKLMKRNKILLFLAFIAACLTACDDTTDGVGSSVVDNLDNVNVKCDTFSVASESVKVDSVYSRSTTGYLGRVKDPETGSVVTGDFTTQFYTLEGTQLPEEKSIKSKMKDGTIIADSCILYLYYDTYFGDSLSTMKLTAKELARPMEENEKYYSNSMPLPESKNMAEGKIYYRTSKGCVNVGKTYSLYDLAADTVAKKIRIKLPNSKFNADSSKIIGNYAYIDKDKKGYNNYGTYLMQKFYENPKNYKNAYTFIHNVCPGFFFKVTDGLGSMAYINMSQMLVYYRYSYEKTENNVKKDTTVNVVSTFAGTEEVQQATSFSGNNGKIDLDSKEYTYIKSPSGVFTLLTLPVDEVMDKIKNDSINSARLSLTRINNRTHDKYDFNYPSTLLMVQKGKKDKIMKEFFEKGKLADNVTSCLAAYSATDNSTPNTLANSYTFHNISNIIMYIYRTREAEIRKEMGNAYYSASEETLKQKREEYNTKNQEWNKVYVVPVTTKYESSSSSQQLVKVENNMGLTSTKLVKGDGIMPANKDDIKMKLFVVHSKFEK